MNRKITKKKPYVIVGLSGGVDSSVAALLLLKQGCHVEGFFMRNWEEEGDSNCAVDQDLLDTQNLCAKLGIRLHTENFATDYWDRVFAHFLAEYKAGRTPNPDILCNKEIKFKVFLNAALKMGADAIATGHYARVCRKNGAFYLLKGLDGEKDQSYFLHALNQKQLSQVIFPLGELTKTRVREIAKSNGFRNHDKKSSTGICFIGERNFKKFLSNYLPAKPGKIETPDGEVVGRHEGLMYYTIGQREGIGIGGQKNRPEAPWYVADKYLEKNTLAVVQGKNHPALFKKQLMANNLHWINGKPDLAPPFRVQAKIRYRQSDQLCALVTLEAERAKVVFDEPQRAVTPGQSIVFYKDDCCLGGGVIDCIENS